MPGNLIGIYCRIEITINANSGELAAVSGAESPLKCQIAKRTIERPRVLTRASHDGLGLSARHGWRALGPIAVLLCFFQSGRLAEV